MLAAVLVAAAMARRRRREPAKARRSRREPTPFALIVAGQIRMLRDPRLLGQTWVRYHDPEKLPDGPLGQMESAAWWRLHQ